MAEKRIQSKPVRVALLFTDGVGVGARDAAVNPLARRSYLLSQFTDGPGTPLPKDGEFVTLEASFGVPGRPQSASNQTALLTGKPAPALIGRHVLGFPDPALRALLAEHSLVKRLREAGQRAEFANCYPAGYLDLLKLRRRDSPGPDVTIPQRAQRRLKPSATTCAFAAGDVALRTLEDARQNLGLTNDISGRRARARGFDVPERTAEEAAEVFWRLAQGVHFTLFEHYLADEAGHAQDWAAAEDALVTFDAFARAVLERRPDDAMVLICSDHGNVEDLSSRNHTLASVPLLAFGRHGGLAALKTLADVAPFIGEHLRTEGP